MIIVSSRTEIPLRQVATSVSVLTADDIQARGDASLVNVLRTLPSVSVSNQGGAGKVTAMRIRGEEGFRTRVLIDGLDISDVSSPQVAPQVQHILTGGIDRVEVLRGSQGMMYGADAGGVVRISTRRAEQGINAQLHSEGGRYGSRQHGANISAAAGPVDAYFTANNYQTDGFNATVADVDGDDDGYRNQTRHGRLGWDVNSAVRLEGIWRDVDSRAEYDSCFSGFCTDYVGYYEEQSQRYSASLDVGATQHRLAWQEVSIDREDVSSSFSFGAEGDIQQWEYLGEASLAEGTQLVYGADQKQERLGSGSDADKRDQWGSFVEYQQQFGDRVYLTLGARYDDNDDFGTHWSYRGSAAYLLPVGEVDVVKFKAALGTGFRAPSLYEIDYNRGPFVSPAAAATDLQEEQSRGMDIGVEYYFDSRAQLELVYFDQRIEQEIFFNNGYLQADGRSESSGWELVGDVAITDLWSLEGNYTYNRTEDSDGDPRARRPRHLANLGISFRPSEQLGLRAFARTSRDAEATSGEHLDNYTVLNLRGDYSPWQPVTFYGRIDNLTNRDYQEVVGYRAPGRAAYAGVRVSF